MKVFYSIIAILTLLFEPASAKEIAIIVHKTNPVTDISFNELIKIFKQDRRFWDGDRIYLILQETGSKEKEIVLKKIYKATDEELKKLWVTKMFAGKISSYPKTCGSNESMKRFVSQIPTAVGFMDATIVDDTVKVLRIDNSLPGDANYTLKD